jgi:hypothetical protein
MNNVSEQTVIRWIFEKYPYLRTSIQELKHPIPRRLLGVAVISPFNLNEDYHVPVFDNELRDFVAEWVAYKAPNGSPYADRANFQGGLLCLVPLQ